MTKVSGIHLDLKNDTSLRETFTSLMIQLGMNIYGPHLEGTAQRVIDMYKELFHEEPWEFTTFSAGDENGIVLVRDIPFTSLCAHHWLPFTGVAHIAYVPGTRLAGLSKLARAVQHYCYGPTVQEEIGKSTAEFLDERLEPLGVAVILRARHSCMEIRGVKAHGSETVTSHLRGCFYEDPSARAELFSLLQLK